MAKVRTPLLSIDASGQLGKSLVFLRWKGIRDVRKYVIPANPRTNLQQAQRSRFQLAVQAWHSVGMTGTDKEAWGRYSSVSGRIQSGFNAFVQWFVKTKLQNKIPLSINSINFTQSGNNLNITGASNLDGPITAYVGTSKTLFPIVATGNVQEGVINITVQNLSPGVQYYIYLEQTAQGKEGRTGLYVFTISA